MSQQAAGSSGGRIIRAVVTSKKNNMIVVCGLLAGALVWGLIWYPYRVLDSAGVGGATSSFLTYLLALLPGLWIFRARLARWRDAPWLLFGIAIAAGICNLGYVLATILGEVVRVMLLFYLAPLWTLMFARLLLGERPGKRGYPVIGLSLAGAIVMLWHPDARLPVPYVLAEWLGLGAGMAFALANVLSRKAAAFDEGVKSIAVWAGVTLVALPVAMLTEQPFASLAALDAQAWLLTGLVALVLFCVNVVIQFALARTSANRAIVIMLSELLFAAVSAYWLAAEEIGWREGLGGVMLVTAALLSGRLEASSHA